MLKSKLPTFCDCCSRKHEQSLTCLRNQREDSPSLTWSSLQPLLENAIPHVLIILDCCFAANAARDITEGTTKEILAACGRENPTLGVGIRSFTSALVEELYDFGDKPFTVAMLHSRLITLRWRLAFTPIYAFLSESGGNSIQLAPLPSIDASELVGQSSIDPSEYDVQDRMDVTSDNPSSSSPRSDVTTKTRVLLAVSVARSVSTGLTGLTQWVEWLTTLAPDNVTDIDVQLESLFDSHSTLMLISIPTYAWSRLPDNAAYQFVGFIRSRNLLSPPKRLKPMLASIESSLKTRYMPPSFYSDIYESTWGKSDETMLKRRKAANESAGSEERPREVEESKAILGHDGIQVHINSDHKGAYRRSKTQNWDCRL